MQDVVEVQNSQISSTTDVVHLYEIGLKTVVSAY